MIPLKRMVKRPRLRTVYRNLRDSVLAAGVVLAAVASVYWDTPKAVTSVPVLTPTNYYGYTGPYRELIITDGNMTMGDAMSDVHTIPKGSSGNLVNSSITDNGTTGHAFGTPAPPSWRCE